MTNSARIAVLLLLCCWLAMTAMAQQPQPATPATAAAPEMSAKSATNDPAYVIGAEDVLQVNVWKEPELSGTFPVRPDGKISLPLLNDMQAASLTPVQLAEAVREKLKKYLEAPRVTVMVTTINSRRVYLMGQVGRQGALPLQAKMTVLQAISTAGGLLQFANSKRIYVLRTENGKQVRLPFNYKEVIKGNHPEQNFLLEPGDTIVVP
jgi:polysaccharide export outer membrane protein